VSTNNVVQDRLDLTFLALSNRTRRQMLSILRQGEITVKELSQSFEMSMQAVVKHLKVLEKAGLISRSKEAQKRPSKLETKPLKEAVEWLEDYRELWNQSFDKLDGYIDHLKQLRK
jgi:DNA-binding transcriptional ArsR family regulator